MRWPAYITCINKEEKWRNGQWVVVVVAVAVMMMVGRAGDGSIDHGW